jgi:glycosyltransferase involved in cell wall biosynthesis
MKSANPLVSVIMPCYNASRFVSEAILCVIQQTYSNTEIIVVDDGSSDTSTDIVRELAETYHGRIHLLQQNHRGPYPARNLGLRHANGEYISFLDADDWWRKDCLEILLGTLQKTGADLAYCGWQNVGDNAPGQDPYIPPAYEAGDMVALFLGGCPWPIHAALTSRDVVNAVNGFSERRFASMDYDFWLRILAHTRNMIRVPEVLAFYRWHGKDQISSTKWRQVLDAVQVRRDFANRHPALISHIPSESLNDLVEGQLLKEAYRVYWKRDLPNAQKLFRAALASRAWHTRDLKYLLPSILPSRLFQGLVGLTDKSREAGQ